MKTVSHHPPDAIYTLGMTWGLDLIKQRSGGRLTYDLYASGSLYNLQKASEALMKGLVQVGIFKCGYFISEFKEAAEASNLPYNYPFDTFAARMRDPGGFYDWAASYYDPNSVKLMGWYTMPGYGFLTKKPVTRMEDMKGLLIKTTPGTQADGIKLLGAEPLFIPSGETYDALQKGTIDGSCSSIGTCVGDKLAEVAKYYICADFSTAGIENAMNLQFFNSLPPDLQKIVLDSFKESQEKYYAEAVKYQQRDRDRATAMGVKVTDISKTEVARWRDAMKPIYDAMQKKYGDGWTRFLKIRGTLTAS